MEFNLKKTNLLVVLPLAPFFLWGTAMVAMKGVIPHTTPLFMAGVRLLPAGLLVLIAAAILGRNRPQNWRAWLWIVFFAIVDGVMFQGFLAEGLVRTDAGLGSAIIDSQPIAVALLCSWLFGEAIGLWGWLGLSVGIVGICLIGLPEELIYNLVQTKAIAISFSWENLFDSGELLMLLASISMAVGTVMIRFVTRHVDPIVATGWHLVLAGLFLLLGSGIWESGQWSDIDFNGWIALGYATIFGSAIAYGLFFYLASQKNLTSLSSLTFLTPVFALIFGHLFLSESLLLVQWLGVALTLTSIYLINQRQNLPRQLVFLTLKSNGRQIIKAASNSTQLETNSQSSNNSNWKFSKSLAGTKIAVKVSQIESEQVE